MAQDIKTTIKVDAGQSQKTVKQLKDDIKALRDNILNLKKGTTEYNNAVEQLQSSQRELDEVMGLTKKTATALEGSYDAMVHKMAQLKKEWRATADVAKRADLSVEIDKLNAELKELDAEIGNYQRNVGNYVSHWEGMPDVTKDFGTALKEANQAIEPTKQGLEGLGNLASGLAAGYAAVQGAAALLGVENDKLEKTFVKLQAAIALTQGISGMKGLFEGIGKLSAVLGVSIKTLGIWGAAIAAVGTAFYALFSNLPSVKKQQAAWDLQIENSIKAQEKFKQSIENANTALSKRIELLQAQGVAEKETLQMQINAAKSNKDAAWDNLMKAQNKYIFDVKSDAQGVMEMTDGAFKQKYGMNKKDALAHYKKLMDDATDFYHQQEAIYNDYLHQMEVLEQKERTQFENRLKGMEEALKSEEEKLRIQYEKDLKQAEEYGMDTSIITKKYQADLKALKEKYKSATDAISGTQTDDPNKTLRANIKERISLEKEATNRKLKNLEIERQKEVELAYNTISDEEQLNNRLEEIDRDYAGKKYQIELKSKEDILTILREWETANTDAKMQEVEIAEDIANQIVDIEYYKQQRLTDIAEQGAKDRYDAEQRAREEAKQKGSGTPQTETEEEKEKVTLLDELEDALDAFEEKWEAFKPSEKILEISKVVGTAFQGTAQIFNQLADMQGDYSQLSEKEQKKVKNLRIAGATMDMLGGIVGAISSAAGMGPLGWAMGAIQAGVIATTGALNIKAIKNTKADGSTNVGGSMGAVTPSSNIFGTDTPFSYTRNVTGQSEVDSLNEPVKVYVTESDITDAVNKSKVRVEEASF